MLYCSEDNVRELENGEKMDNGKKSKVTQSRDLLVSSILADTELAADFLRNYRSS